MGKIIFLFILMISCSEKELNPDEEMAIEIWDEIKGYESWNQPENFSGIQESNTVHGNFVQIWLNGMSSEFFSDSTNENELMMGGSIIVKESYNDSQGEDKTGITVMKKIIDYDPLNNNWFWINYKPDGTLGGKNGAEQSCYNCHQSGKDYVLFSGQ